MRPCKQPGVRRHPELGHSNRHISRTTSPSEEPPDSRPGPKRPPIRPESPRPSTRDRLASVTHLAVAGSGWDRENRDTLRRTSYQLRGLPGMDQSSVAESAEAGGESVCVDSFWLGPDFDLSSLRLRVLEGTPGGLLRIEVLADRGERPVPRHLPDGVGGTSPVRDDRVLDRIRADRRCSQLLRGCRLAAVELRVGPVRVW